MGRIEKPTNTKHREGDYMCYTYYREFKQKDGAIVYHKNKCRKRVKPEAEKKKRGRKVCDAVSRYKKLKKQKETAIRELKKKLILKVDSFSLSDLRVIADMVDNSPGMFAERVINTDSIDSVDSVDSIESVDNTDSTDSADSADSGGSADGVDSTSRANNSEPLTTGEALEVLRSML